MKKQYLTLGLGLLLAASGFVMIQTMEQRPRGGAPALRLERLCPDLALGATPGRLVTQAQTGAAALLNCPR